MQPRQRKSGRSGPRGSAASYQFAVDWDRSSGCLEPFFAVFLLRVCALCPVFYKAHQPMRGIRKSANRGELPMECVNRAASAGKTYF